jgi:hypothetical protein
MNGRKLITYLLSVCLFPNTWDCIHCNIAKKGVKAAWANFLLAGGILNRERTMEEDQN